MPTPLSSAALTSSELRASFLDFFREKGHEIVPSAPLVPQDDPTLMFINAGMNPFKDVFLGTGKRPYVRAADTQKCLRVSGKHNDLDEVGIDTYHHTFFEMLGNWSFGDYFKPEAIAWAWELLVDRWGLDPDRLYVTVHEGDEALGLGPDQEAADLWTEHTSVPPSHILFQSSKDNFWMMGDTGPCGPCSEIHVDLRDDRERALVPGAELVNQDDPRVMEIWNLVFIQYNAFRKASHARENKLAELAGDVGASETEEERNEMKARLSQYESSDLDWDTWLEPLPAKHIDTGMGFERICAVLQGKTSNYDTDLFTPILDALSKRAGLANYHQLDEADEEQQRQRVAMRVVADHVRTLAFAIADGAQPSNTGRGYVIRRILRRAVRYGYQGLGLREPFLASLLPALASAMGEAFPEIVEQQETIGRIITGEEEAFLRTLGAGIEMFETVADAIQADEYTNRGWTGAAMKADPRGLFDIMAKAFGTRGMSELATEMNMAHEAQAVPGGVTFLLHDTYGFPSDLTAVMARERGLTVDKKRFNELMEEQRERARAAAGFSVDHSVVERWDGPEIATLTVGDFEPNPFVGYDTFVVHDANVLRTRSIDQEDRARHELVLNKTPFYAESGGQVGDTGTLTVGEEVIQVLDTVKDAEGTIIHVVDRLPSSTGDVTATVDADRRQRIMRHHTATHLLHAALREALGDHVQQKGSLVAPDRLRFDFSHFERVTPEQQRQLEARVNAFVLRNVLLQEDRNVPIAEAKERGAMALFGEKYGETVRVITFVSNDGDLPDSVELCGGTHVRSTGEVGLFRITSEGSVASGVRRVEAVAGEAALDWLAGEMNELEAARSRFKQIPDGLATAIESLQDETKDLSRQLDALKAEQAAAGLDTFLANAQDLDGLQLVTGRVDGADMNTLRDLAETARERLGTSGVAVFGSADEAEGKAYLAASVTDDLLNTVQAGKLVGALAKRIGGGGGGRPHLATAGGKNPAALDDALAATADEVRQLVG
ncbi:MAG: alanine--tRNA ligase [Rubricoccaceae bacterium]